MPENDIIFRQLQLDEIILGIDLFARSVVRTWPNTYEEAAGWVKDEFSAVSAILYGAFVNNKLIGLCVGTPYCIIWRSLAKHEQNLLSTTFEYLSYTNDGIHLSDPSKILHIGGISVDRDYEQQGIASKLFAMVESLAREEGYIALVAHIAGDYISHPQASIKSLIEKWGMHKMPIIRLLYYNDPPDLEKLWYYKTL